MDRNVLGEPASTDDSDGIDISDLTDEVDDAADREAVEQERAELKEFVKGLTADDIKSGNWFTKLLAQALDNYTKKVDWQYFQEKYEGVPADAIVDQRIKLASRYASIEGGLSASAYTLAIVATLGSGGAASPGTVPAALATVMVDVAFLSRLQLRLAYDISVLYRVPLDVSDPEDLWKLIRVAFTIKSGELAREGVLKVVPALVRPLIKRFYSKGVLAAAKAIPVVGKFLLQRNVIKIGIPLVGIPLAVLVNRWTTLVAGRHARLVFRNEARIIEVASNLTKRTQHPSLLLWVAWVAVTADGRITDDEALLMRHLVKLVREQHNVIDVDLAQAIDTNRSEVWRRIEATPGDLSDLPDAAYQVVAIDGAPGSPEHTLLAELARVCDSHRPESWTGDGHDGI